MKDLCIDSIKAISGGSGEDFQYFGNCMLEDLGNDLQRFSVFLVMEGNFFAKELIEDAPELLEDVLV